MQAVLEVLKHIAIVIAVFGHALVFSFIPHTEPTQHSPIGSGEPRTSVASASATSSAVQTKLFPIAAPTKSTSTSATSSATQASRPRSAPADSRGLPQEPQNNQQTSAQAKPPVPLLPQSIVNDAARVALVNIFCTTKSGGYLYPISGSGVMITKNGVILTNAHVGQYFLLRDYLTPNNVDCRIRTGSPAQATYRAELLYLPPSWINANAKQIAAQESMGTGQDDYSFLRITSPMDVSAPLPAVFSALAMTTDNPQRQEPVLLASYPAGFLSGITIQMSLYISTVLTQVAEVFAFNDKGNADVVSLGGSLVAQAGSSGGAVVRQQDGALQAIIATETESTTTTSTAGRDLHAITLGHIDRSLKQEGVGGIANLLTGDLQAKAKDFANNTAPAERQKLFDVLNKH